MRICQVMLSKEAGGAQQSFIDTARALADRGHAVQAVCHRDFAKRDLLEMHPQIRVTPVHVGGAWDLFGVRRLRRAIGEFGPDILHVHLARAAQLAAPIGRRMGVPVVAKLHNYVNLKYYSAVTAFIGTTEDQRQYLAGNGIDGDRVTVIPNFSRVPAIDTPRQQPVAKAARPIRFVTCGRLHEVKGFDILLRALRRLVDSGYQVQVHIGGDGPARDALHRLRAELNLEEEVEFAGWIDDQQRFLDGGDIYVLSSRTESFGISLLEAMARGLPIVSTRCKGPSQLLSDSQAWFATPENVDSLTTAMRTAIDQAEQRSTRGRELRDLFLNNYSESLVVPRILEFYEHCGARDSGGSDLDSAWPKQFVEATSLADVEQSDTRMLVRRSMALEFRERNWTSCAAVMEAQDVDVLRVTNGRDNCRAEFGNFLPAGRRRIVFLKRHREKLRSALRPAGWSEAEAAAICERSGVAVMQIIAAGYEKHVTGRTGRDQVDSFSISEGLPGEAGFETVMKWHAEGVFHEPAVASLRRQMIEAAANLVRRMHAAGLAHQDLFWTHLFFENRGGMVAARVIDVQRMFRPSATWAYYWIKDLEQIRYSMQRMRFSEDEIAYWYCSYFATKTLTHWQRLLTGVVRLRGIRRALRMAIRNRRRSQPATTPVAVTQPTAQRRAA